MLKLNSRKDSRQVSLNEKKLKQLKFESLNWWKNFMSIRIYVHSTNIMNKMYETV